MNNTPRVPDGKQHAARVARLGRIGILMGGCSSERQISLKSGVAIYDALRLCGCDAIAIDITACNEDGVLSAVMDAAVDVVFIALHGRFGEDGTLQGILEKKGIPYTGSGVAASRRAINKITSQELFAEHGLSVPAYAAVGKESPHDVGRIITRAGGLPVVVKPANEGSSIGITIVDDKNKLLVALQTAFQYDNDVLVERYIKGRELTVGILDGQPLPVVEIRPKRAFFDFSAKYEVGMTDYIVPAEIVPSVAHAVQAAGLGAHRILGCSGYSRVDVLLDETGTPYILEVNTIPGFTQTSLLPKAAKAAGIDFTELCIRLIELAYGKQK